MKLFHFSTEALCAGVNARRLHAGCAVACSEAWGRLSSSVQQRQLRDCCTSGDKYPLWWKWQECHPHTGLKATLTLFKASFRHSMAAIMQNLTQSDLVFDKILSVGSLSHQNCCHSEFHVFFCHFMRWKLPLLKWVRCFSSTKSNYKNYKKFFINQSAYLKSGEIITQLTEPEKISWVNLSPVNHADSD